MSERQAEEDRVLAGFLDDLVRCPRRLIQSALLVRVPLDEIFDLPEHHFHEHGLGAGPAAPEPPIGCRENDDAGDEHQQGHREHDHVLRPEDLAQDDELALDDIDQQQRVAFDPDEGPREHDREQQPAQQCASAEEPAAHLPRVQPLAVSLLVRRGEVVPEVFPVHILDGTRARGDWMFGGLEHGAPVRRLRRG